ncbi:MAG TPA: hypothetical protein VHP36_08100, partial [Chitinispirillaceae bacterium]|nr:hypothetical protein [Chitinispirillaceae bacterium]
MKMINRQLILTAICVLFLKLSGFSQESDPVSSLFTIEYFGQAVGVSLSADSFQCLRRYDKLSLSNDLTFKGDSIYCPSGITFNPDLEQKLNFAKIYSTIINDPQIVYYYDNVLSKEYIKAPETGYSTSAPLNKKLYFVKAPDGRYGALLKIGEYFGGIDRLHFYQAMNNNSRLYKFNLYKVPSYVDFTAMYMFSGRPDPVFRISDPTALNRLFLFIYRATNYLEDPTIIMENPEPVQARLGTPVFVINHNFNTCASSEEKSVLQVGYGRIELNYPNSKKTFIDKSNQLEKLIYDIGRGANLISTDNVGQIAFRTLFPDTTQKNDTLNNKNWTSLMTVQNNLDSGISSVASFEKDGKCQLFVAAGDSGVYSISYTVDQNRVVSNVTKHREGLDNKKVLSLALFDSVLYAGTQKDGVFRKKIGGEWESFSDGLSIISNTSEYPVITEMVFEDSMLFAFAGVYGKNMLYAYKGNESKWVKALDRYGINISTPVENLADTLPFSVRKQMLLWKNLIRIDSTAFYSVAGGESDSGWKMMNIVKSGNFLTAVTFKYRAVDSYISLHKILFVSADGGITWKTTLSQINAPAMKITRIGDTLYCGIPGKRYDPTTSVIRLLADLYVSFDNGRSWEECSTGIPTTQMSFLGSIGDQLCVTAQNGEVFVTGNNRTQVKEKSVLSKKIASRMVKIHCGSKKTSGIRIPVSEQYSSFSVLNLQGKIVTKIGGDLTEVSQISVPPMGSGVYLFKAVSENRQYVKHF